MIARRYIFAVLFLSLTTSPLLGQMSTEEAMKRLAERQAAAVTRPAPADMTRPVVAKPAGPLRVRDDAPDAIKDYWKRCQVEKADRIKNAKQIIADNAKALANNHEDEATNKARRESIQNEQALIKTISAPDFIALVEMNKNSAVGDVGTIRGAKIIQVIDAKNCLVNLLQTGHETRATGNTISTIETREASLDVSWISGIDLTCSPKTDPPVMRVFMPLTGKEILDEFKSQEASFAGADHRASA